MFMNTTSIVYGARPHQVLSALIRGERTIAELQRSEEKGWASVL